MHLPTLPPVFAVGIITGIGALVGWIVGAVLDIVAAVSAALVAVWAVFLPILAPLWHALRAIWGDVLQPAWETVKAWGEKVYALYQDHVKPILDKLQKVQSVLRRVYAVVIQPFRDLTSILEEFLRLTHLDHTAFGEWLDGELHRIDTTLEDAWRTLVAPINAILRILNEVILGADGLLRAPLLLESTAKHMGTLTQQWWDRELLTIQTDWDLVLKQFHTGPSSEAAVTDTINLVRGDPSGLDQWHDHGVEVFQLAAKDDWRTLDYIANGVGGGGV